VNRKKVNPFQLLIILPALAIAGCSGVSIGIPIGGVMIGTTVSTGGDVGVGASTSAGSVGVSGKSDAHPGFADVPDDAPATDKKAKAADASAETVASADAADTANKAGDGEE